MTKLESKATYEDNCTAIITDSKRITSEDTDEVRQIILRIDDPSFGYTEGQSIGILIPGPHEFGNKYHHRRYSIANAQNVSDDKTLALELLVRRCFYIDEISGEEYPGIASNYLCNANPGDSILVTGPYHSPFKVPSDPSSNMVLIGTGTGIAPFRGIIQHLYKKYGDWKGKVRLFYGAKTGLDMLYMNDLNNDLTNYYDKDTFEAFNAIGHNYFSTADEALEQSLEEKAKDVWSLINEPSTFVLLAGMGKIVEKLNAVMAKAAGSEQEWERTKQRLVNEGRWSELIYR
jgi:ferredoxin--NADP+ reductase